MYSSGIVLPVANDLDAGFIWDKVDLLGLVVQVCVLAL
jgi:hypothetical protein